VLGRASLSRVASSVSFDLSITKERFEIVVENVPKSVPEESD
jgi:hypothetical protein